MAPAQVALVAVECSGGVAQQIIAISGAEKAQFALDGL